MIFYALEPHLNPPEASSGQVLQCRGLKVKNEVGALATSIIYEPKAFSIAESGIKHDYGSLFDPIWNLLPDTNA